ncbi:Glu/Leu/Phe/Val dehydrogenase dimerization domain-containing protein [Amycolatopsis sp. GM8]|uniref:Glu/Leu/Phe/Val dehydrogenase dimerization domain-containing protein n=1 Tax=Amycolatopsis sp. GM8 TaxID=2896530 RepID=UPI001F337640|nr:Glu/Leu/Phe/Val dehydrogenase dimerization domain-containing protein [Amycolatopsis sp. GM8]
MAQGFMNNDIVVEDWAGELTAVRHDEETGAHFVIAVHSTRLGPATGGTRAMVYSDVADAVADARRLAGAMTYKMAVAGLPMGGGKSVIALPAPRAELDSATWRRILQVHAANLRLLKGSYWTGPDIGTNSGDMDILRRSTDYVFGRSIEAGGPGSSAGNTAVGVFAAVQAAAREAGVADLSGRRVLIPGLGAVGAQVAEFAREAGARLLVADISHDRCAPFEAQGAQRVPVDEVTTTECDVLVPCATGGLITTRVAETVPCAAIAGAANNVLAGDEAAEVLRRRGICYAPDFVANAGGAIHLVGREVLRWSAYEVRVRVLEIGETVERIFKSARAQDITTGAAARQIAEANLAAALA